MAYGEWTHLKNNIKRIDRREYYTICGSKRFVHLDDDGNPSGEPRAWCDKCQQWVPWDVHVCIPLRPEALHPKDVWSDDAGAVEAEKAFFESPQGPRTLAALNFCADISTETLEALGMGGLQTLMAQAEPAGQGDV